MEETYHEKKQRKELEKEAGRKQQKQKQFTRSFMRYFIAVLIVFLLGYGFWALIKKELPEGEDASIVYEIQGQNHIEVGTEHPPYNSNPPSSGWHYNAPAPVGFYEETIPDEQVIHNLEHGDVWITYRPNVSEEVKNMLRNFTEDPKVIVTPREANDKDLALVSWGRVDAFDIEDELNIERIEEFIFRHKNKAPERVTQPRLR